MVAREMWKLELELGHVIVNVALWILRSAGGWEPERLWPPRKWSQQGVICAATCVISGLEDDVSHLPGTAELAEGRGGAAVKCTHEAQAQSGALREASQAYDSAAPATSAPQHAAFDQNIQQTCSRLATAVRPLQTLLSQNWNVHRCIALLGHNAGVRDADHGWQQSARLHWWSR